MMNDHAGDMRCTPARKRTRRKAAEIDKSFEMMGVELVPNDDGSVQYWCRLCGVMFAAKFKAEKHKCHPQDGMRTGPPMAWSLQDSSDAVWESGMV